MHKTTIACAALVCASIVAAQTPEYGYQVVHIYPHDRNAFTQGLEFRAVVVMACDAHNLPYSRRIETVADESDLEEVYNTERHLLYVACTRARDRLLVTGVTPASEFLADLGI